MNEKMANDIIVKNNSGANNGSVDNQINYDKFNIYELKTKDGVTKKVYKKVDELAIMNELDNMKNIQLVNGDVPYIYENNYWQCDPKGVKVKQIIRNYIINDLLRVDGANNTNKVYNNLQQDERFQCDETFLEVNRKYRKLVPCEDCVVNTETLEILPHNKKYGFRHQIPWKIKDIMQMSTKELEEKSSVFLNFLDQNCKSDEIDGLEGQKRCLLEYIGYAMTQAMDFKYALLIYGGRDSGKSVLINAINKLIGAKNTSNIPLQDMEKDKFTLWQLEGKSLNSNADLDSTALTTSGTFKKIIGGDKLTAERKGVDKVDFTPYCKQIYATNEKIKMTGDKSDATIEKVIYISWNYVPTKKDVNLLDKIIEELPYIAVLAIRYVHRAFERGELTESAYSKRMKEEVKKISDPLEAFIQDMCEKDVKGKIKTKDFHNAFKTYCNIQGSISTTNTRTKESMESKGYTVIKPQNKTHYKGLKFKDINDIEEEFREVLYPNDSTYTSDSNNGIKFNVKDEKQAQKAFNKVMQLDFNKKLEK